MKYFLSVTNLIWGNDPDADNILYSEYGCIKNMENIENKIIIDNSDPKYCDWKSINEQINKSEERLLPIITMNLNRVHQVNFNKKQWRCILAYWFEYYLDAMYQKYILIKDIIETYDVYSFALDPESFIHPTYNNVFFVWTMRTEEYNFQLYSHALEFLGIEIRQYVKNPSLDKNRYLLNENKQVIKLGKVNADTLILNPNDFCFSALDKLLLKVFSNR